MKIILFTICIISFSLLLLLLLKSRSKQIDEDESLDYEEKPPIASNEIINETRIIAPMLSDIISEIQKSIVPNMTTKELDTISNEVINKFGFNSAMLNYRGYPASTCISVNEEILHCIPSSKKIKNGDLITIQTAIKGKSAYANQGWSFTVGSVSDEKLNLYKKGIEALKNAIEIVNPETSIGNISSAIQTTIEDAGYSVIREFVGYGMGKEMHQAPQIPCYGKNGIGNKIKPGMILNIHVIAAMGDYKINISEDGWSTITKDGQPSVLFSAMILVEENGKSLLSKILE